MLTRPSCAARASWFRFPARRDNSAYACRFSCGTGGRGPGPSAAAFASLPFHGEPREPFSAPQGKTFECNENMACCEPKTAGIGANFRCESPASRCPECLAAGTMGQRLCFLGKFTSFQHTVDFGFRKAGLVRDFPHGKPLPGEFPHFFGLRVADFGVTPEESGPFLP